MCMCISMCVKVCVLMWMCLHAWVYVHMCSCMWIYECVNKQVYVRVYICTCEERVSVHDCVCQSECVMYMHMCMYVCISVCASGFLMEKYSIWFISWVRVLLALPGSCPPPPCSLNQGKAGVEGTRRRAMSHGPENKTVRSLENHFCCWRHWHLWTWPWLLGKAYYRKESLSQDGATP